MLGLNWILSFWEAQKKFIFSFFFLKKVKKRTAEIHLFIKSMRCPSQTFCQIGHQYSAGHGILKLSPFLSLALPPPLSDKMLKLWKWYQHCLSSHPVKTQIISSGILWGIGDIGAQYITHSTALRRLNNSVSSPPSAISTFCTLFCVLGILDFLDLIETLCVMYFSSYLFQWAA